MDPAGIAFLYPPSKVQYLAEDGTIWLFHSDRQGAYSLFHLDLPVPTPEASIVAPPPSSSQWTPALPPPGTDASKPSSWSWAPVPQLHTAVVPLAERTVVATPTPLPYPYLELASSLAEGLAVSVVRRWWQWLRRHT